MSLVQGVLFLEETRSVLSERAELLSSCFLNTQNTLIFSRPRSDDEILNIR